MDEQYDFEIVPNTRDNTPSIKKPDGYPMPHPGADALMGAVANNFDTILNLAGQVVQIQQMKVAGDLAIRDLEAKTRALEAETESYVKRLHAQTDAVVDRAEVVRKLMRDYYEYGSDKLSGEDFSKIITDVLKGLKLEDA